MTMMAMTMIMMTCCCCSFDVTKVRGLLLLCKTSPLCEDGDDDMVMTMMTMMAMMMVVMVMMMMMLMLTIVTMGLYCGDNNHDDDNGTGREADEGEKSNFSVSFNPKQC